MKSCEYSQDENETSGWLIYAEYVEWAIREGMYQPKIEDRCCKGSQQESDLTELTF